MTALNSTNSDKMDEELEKHFNRLDEIYEELRTYVIKEQTK